MRDASPEDAVAAWVGILASGLLYGLLFPPFGAAGLSWLALVPLALAWRGGHLGRGAALAASSTFVMTACVITWLVPTLHDHFEKSWTFSVAFWLLLSATALAPYYAPLLAAQAWAARRLPRAFAPFIFAAAWVAAEWLRTQLGFRSPWMRLGDAQVEAIRLRQVADLFGVCGLSFLIALGNGVIAEAIATAAARWRDDRMDWRPVAASASAFVVLLACAIGYGTWRLGTLAGSASRFEVAAVQGAVDPELRWKRSQAGRVLRRYGGLTRDLLLRSESRDPDLVVWPENAVQTHTDDPVYGPPLLRLSSKVPLLIGAPRSESDGNGRRAAFNSALLLVDGELRGHYDKRRLLPFSETQPFGDLGAFGSRGNLDPDGYSPGTSGVLFEVAGQQVAPLICMEALYPDLAREAVSSGATILAVLSNDGWFLGRGGAEQHAAMVVFRAVEIRRPVVRATTTGISAVIGPDGSIVGSLGDGERGVLRAEVPLTDEGPTLYARIGDAFAILCALAVAAAVGVAWRRELRRQ